MKRHVKYLSYLIFLVTFFFSSNNYVDAVTFNSGAPIEQISGFGTTLKYKNGSSERAYCSDRDKGFASGIDYSVDTDFLSSNSCEYKTRSETSYHTNGDCSEIVGYIIAWGKTIFNTPRMDHNPSASITDIYGAGDKVGSMGYPDKVWYWTQASIWAYLANHSPWRGSNTKAAGLYSANKYIQEVVNMAMEEYAIHSNYGTVSIDGTNASDAVNFSLSVENNNVSFYYTPQSGSSTCGSNGSYKTKKITVTNNEPNRSISVSLTTNNKGNIKICIENNSNCEGTKVVSLDSKSSITFYLTSQTDVTETVVLEAVASYTGQAQIDIQYDSVRYETGYDNTQGMITWKDYYRGNTAEKIRANVNYYSKKTKNFNKVAVIRRSCADTQNGGAGQLNSTTDDYQKIQCANNYTTSGSNNLDYRADFSGCTCLGIDLGNGNSVGIIINETVAFRYGNIIPNSNLFAGGGFAFDSDGIPTSYAANVAWTFANYTDTNNDSKPDIPYYYNSDGTDYNANNVASQINSKLTEMIQNNLNDLKVKFSTYDSNDYKLTTDDVTLSLNLGSPSFVATGTSGIDGFVYKANFSLEKLKLNDAYFAADGTVKYLENASLTHNISGGSRYYIPMNFAQDIFPFNLVRTNISIVDGIDFDVEAECGVGVTDKYKSLYYRSIDVSNPFPKPGTDYENVPANWVGWYYGTNAATNQSRMSNTYQYYPNNYNYQITLTSDNFKKLLAYNDYYTSWNNISPDGTSSFITDLDFDTKTPKFCRIGEFKADCDTGN